MQIEESPESNKPQREERSTAAEDYEEDLVRILKGEYSDIRKKDPTGLRASYMGSEKSPFNSPQKMKGSPGQTVKSRDRGLDMDGAVQRSDFDQTGQVESSG